MCTLIAMLRKQLRPQVQLQSCRWPSGRAAWSCRAACAQLVAAPQQHPRTLILIPDPFPPLLPHLPRSPAASPLTPRRTISASPRRRPRAATRAPSSRPPLPRGRRSRLPSRRLETSELTGWARCLPSYRRWTRQLPTNSLAHHLLEILYILGTSCTVLGCQVHGGHVPYALSHIATCVAFVLNLPRPPLLPMPRCGHSRLAPRPVHPPSRALTICSCSQLTKLPYFTPRARGRSAAAAGP